MWSSSGPAHLGFSVLPGFVCLLPSPNQGSFPSLFFQISFQFLTLPLLLLALLWFGYHAFKVVPEASYVLIMFFNIHASSFCTGQLFISSLCSKSLIWTLASFPSLLVPCGFFFIPVSVAFISSLVHLPYSVRSLRILTTSVLKSASHGLAIFILLSSFSGVLICFFIWAILLCILNLAASLCLLLCIG